MLGKTNEPSPRLVKQINYIMPLLAMVGGLMIAHLYLLNNQLNNCNEYKRELVSQIAQTVVRGPDNRELMEDWRGFLNGQL